ncbi:hypothetical protein [Methylomicrobium sp. Wu6]|uniref:hypothetical protein n=1 Tax=Methylomicrobium sp. Wu6 TaxID=3107928 RepID=UPI002DD69CB7|nr:hypothetical protein [Methylomicrobium sp. Wu6]MEC4748004.1 hypothetical protein [Methylomicrobium sp. Wu6]
MESPQTLRSTLQRLAMFPIAFNSNGPGREIMGSMAAIIIGGLVPNRTEFAVAVRSVAEVWTI